MSDETMTVGDAVVRLATLVEMMDEGRRLVFEHDARAIRVVLAALAESAKDSERIGWLDADAERLEEVFGACVRNEEGGILRAIIDAAREARP